MIFDGPKAFPNSVVHFTKFRHFELRHLFASLREDEEILQKEIGKLGGDGRLEQVRELIESASDNEQLLLFRKVLDLLRVQKTLIWMATNVTGSEEERALRRRGFGSEEHRRRSKIESEWDQDKFNKLLKGFIHGK